MNAKTHALISWLYLSFGKRILQVILKRNGGDIQVAEEVLQNTFLAVTKSLHTFHSKSTYFTWICKIALNKMADYYRQQVDTKSKIVAPALEQITSLVDPGISPEEQISLDELKLSVSQSLNLLPTQYRRLLHLKYYEQLSNTQIRLQLGLSPRQLEGQMYRAKKTLAKIYAQSQSRS